LTVLLSERSEQPQQPCQSSANDYNISCDNLQICGQSTQFLNLKPLNISSSVLGNDLKSRTNFIPVKNKTKSNPLNLPSLDMTKYPAKTHQTDADESHGRLLDTSSPLKSPLKEKESSLFMNKTYREYSTNNLMENFSYKDGFLSDSRRFTPTDAQNNTGLKRASSEGLYESLNFSIIDCQVKSTLAQSQNSLETETHHLTERYEYYNDRDRKRGSTRRSTVELELAKAKNIGCEEESKSNLIQIGDSDTTIEKRKGSSSTDLLSLPHLPIDNIRRKSQLDPVAENENENDHVLESNGDGGRDNSTLASPNVVMETGNSTQAHHLQNHSDSENDTGVGVQPAQIVEEMVSDVRQMPEDEVKIFIQRMVILFISLAVLALLIILKANGSIHIHGILKMGYVICAIFVLEKVYRTCCSERKGWRVREDLFSMLDGIDCIFLIGCVDQKLANKLSVSIIAIIPFILTLILCAFTSLAPQAIKNKRIIIRSALSFQVFLLTAKIDEILKIEWRFIFGPAWVFCTVVLLHLIAVMFILILIGIFAILKQRLHNDVDLKTEFAGHLWHCFYYGLCLGLLIFLYGICSDSSHALKLSAVIGMILSIILIGYTALTKSTLVQFMKISYATTHTSTRVAQVPIHTRIHKPTVSLEVEQKQSYFVMLSSTYFKPFDSGFIKKNEDNIKRIKGIIRKNIKVWAPSLSKKSSNVKENKDEHPIKIEVLKQYKETLDKRFKVIKNSHFSEEDQQNRLPSDKPIMTRNFTVDINSPKASKVATQQESSSPRKVIESHFKRHLSAEDNYFTKISATDRVQKSNTEEETLCYLCFEGLPNAVLLNCGHGGICYECAVALIKKKNECMECRKPVEMIYKVDPNPKLSNIIRGVEMSKVTVEQKEI